LSNTTIIITDRNELDDIFLLYLNIVFQELFESPSVVRFLKSYQNKKLARNSYANTDTYASETKTSQQNTSSQQKPQIEGKGWYLMYKPS
jgi:hypothetical protein